MRRTVRLFLGVVLGTLALAAPSALASTTDWAVNGEALPAGHEVSVRFASTTPVQLIAPDKGIDITCASWKAKGTLVGGEIGTGELVKSKFAHCTQMEAGNPVSVKVQMSKVRLQTDLERPVGSGETTEFELIGICFKKGRCEPALEIAGIADSIGPNPAAGNLVGFPQPALPASTLTIGGSPAELIGEAVFKLPKHATLSQVEL